MFMGPKAFAYYFPVIDRYLRDVHGEESDGDCHAGILGSAIAGQLAAPAPPSLRSIASEVAELASHVLENLARYTPDKRMQQWTFRKWSKVAELAAGLSRS